MANQEREHLLFNRNFLNQAKPLLLNNDLKGLRELADYFHSQEQSMIWPVESERVHRQDIDLLFLSPLIKANNARMIHYSLNVLKLSIDPSNVGAALNLACENKCRRSIAVILETCDHLYDNSLRMAMRSVIAANDPEFTVWYLKHQNNIDMYQMTANTPLTKHTAPILSKVLPITPLDCISDENLAYVAANVHLLSIDLKDLSRLLGDRRAMDAILDEPALPLSSKKSWLHE